MVFVKRGGTSLALANDARIGFSYKGLCDAIRYSRRDGFLFGSDDARVGSKRFFF